MIPHFFEDNYSRNGKEGNLCFLHLVLTNSEVKKESTSQISALETWIFTKTVSDLITTHF